MHEDELPDDLRIRGSVENWIYVARGLIYLFAISGLASSLTIALRKECESSDAFGICQSKSFSIDNFALGFWFLAAVLLFVSFAMILLNYVRWKMAATSASLLMDAEMNLKD